MAKGKLILFLRFVSERVGLTDDQLPSVRSLLLYQFQDAVAIAEGLIRKEYGASRKDEIPVSGPGSPWGSAQGMPRSGWGPHRGPASPDGEAPQGVGDREDELECACRFRSRRA